MKINTETYQLIDRGRFGTLSLGVGIVGLALSTAGYFADARQFFHSYLVSFAFWTSIGLGGLFFTLLHHLVGATWSIVLRRLSESIMMALPLMFVFFLPLVFGRHDLYHWSHHDAVEHDPILQGKAGYLNTPFFVVRTVLYFGIWFVLAWLLHRFSLQQDRGEDTSKRMLTVSAPGMILFALTSTYAAFDWLMSLEPHWYSTIYGVWFFAGGLLTFLCFTAVLAMFLRSRGVLGETIKVDHYHDLGRLMFAFLIFWAYISFSQYFLIWYANIPEETVYYLKRWTGSWQTISLLLVFGYLMIPWLALIPRATKRHLPTLGLIAAWLLVMHWMDLHWAVMPNLHSEGFSPSWLDAATLLGIGGIFLWYMFLHLSRHALVPVKDPNLGGSLNHVIH